MSTWVYLRCLDHDPPIRADEESGQHLYDLPQVHNDIAHRAEMLAADDADGEMSWVYENGLAHFRSNTLRFFRRHRTCNLDVIDEYGTIHPRKQEQS